jgi:hypothetical protein
MIFKSRTWFKVAILLALWILSILILITFTADNELNKLYHNIVSHGSGLKPLKNQTGGISYTRLDSKENYRPIYSISLKNLRVENSKLGIFKTGLHKVAKIRGLGLSLHRYSSAKVNAATRINNNQSRKKDAVDSKKPFKTNINGISSVPEETITEVKNLKKIVDKLISPKDGWRTNIDLSNVSEVLVNGFDYKVLYDGHFFFSVESKRLIASSKRSDLELHGHVTIKTAEGNTLESNHIKWDIENQCFTVNGIYVLTRDGVKTMGRGICVDDQLNDVTTQHAKFKRKERQKCLVKL